RTAGNGLRVCAPRRGHVVALRGGGLDTDESRHPRAARDVDEPGRVPGEEEGDVRRIREVGMRRDAEEAAVVRFRYLRRDVDERSREERAVLPYPHDAALEGDEQAPVGREGHAGGEGQPARDGFLDEARGAERDGGARGRRASRS